MSPVPKKLESMLKKSKKPLKFVLFRLPKDLPLNDMNGLSIDLTDLAVWSDKSISAVTDLHTNPDRASACPILPDISDESKSTLKCGDSFSANIQIIRSDKLKTFTKQTAEANHSEVKIKKEIVKKSKKIKEDNDI